MISAELAKRIAFSIVAIPIALAIIWFGGAPLAALLAMLAALAAWELFRMARAGGTEPFAHAGIAAAGLIPLIVHAHYLAIRPGAARVADPALVGDTLASLADGGATAVMHFFTLSWTGAAVCILLLVAASIWARGVAGRPLASVSLTVFGVIYTGGMLSFGYALRYHPYTVDRASGTALVMLPLLLTWSSDTGAYAFGRLFGKRKLMPSVSPGKTVAGAVGGLVASVVVCWLYVDFVLRPVAQLALAPWAIVVFGLLLSVAAQVGDLAESLLKREAGVKDSSTIIPGHGGILDRFDSLLFVLPVSALFFALPHVLLPAPR